MDRPTIYKLHFAENDFLFEVSKIPTAGRRFPGAMDKHAMEKVLLGLTNLPAGVREYGLPDPTAMARLLPELSVEFFDASATLPDRFSCQSATVVSGRAKGLFEKVDGEGGHEFVPAMILNEDKRPVDGDWYYMLCGRSFFASEEPIDREIVTDNYNWLEEQRSYFSTEERRDFFARQPVWTQAAAVEPEYLSSCMFETIRAEGLTGFREFTKRFGVAGADDPNIRQFPTTENVSHYWF